MGVLFVFHRIFVYADRLHFRTCFQRSFYLKVMIRCEVSISQTKFLEIKIMIECIIVTKRQLFLEMWVSKVGAVNLRSDKESEE